MDFLKWDAASGPKPYMIAGLVCYVILWGQIVWRFYRRKLLCSQGFLTSSNFLTLVISPWSNWIMDTIVMQQNCFIKHAQNCFIKHEVYMFLLFTVQLSRRLTNMQTNGRAGCFLLFSQTLSYIPQQAMFKLPIKTFPHKYLWFGHDPLVCTFSCRC